MAKLTIGLIIYNGADAARRCIDSLLGQTFEDFVLLIHDNASTDDTSEICSEFAAKDGRIRHVRHPKTIPQSENFRSVLMAAETEYFMWAADDDVWGKQFAEVCINRLERDRSAVACCTQVMFHYPDGTRKLSRSTHAITGTSAQRVKKYLANPRDSARLYAVYRTRALQASYPTGLSMFGYDWIIVCLSMLEGNHLEVEQIHLERSGHTQGKYFERYDRHFVRDRGLVGRLSYLLPLFPLSKQLLTLLPPKLKWAAALRLVRLNVHQTLLLLAWKYPAFQGLFRFARAIDKAIGTNRA